MYCIILYIYANEARIMWNARLPHHANAFLIEFLDQQLAPIRSGISRLLKKKLRALVTTTSRVVGRLLNDKSNLSFITN